MLNHRVCVYVFFFFGGGGGLDKCFRTFETGVHCVKNAI